MANYDYTLFLSGGKAYKNSAEAENEIDLSVFSGALTVSNTGTAESPQYIWNMNNFEFTTSAGTAVALWDDCSFLTVTGVNTVTGGDAAGEWEDAYGIIFAYNAAVSGSGTLTVKAGSSTEAMSKGISSEKGLLTLDGLTLNVSSGSASSDSRGINVGGPLSVNDASVTVTAGSAGSPEAYYSSSVAVFSDAITINGSGEIKAVAGTAAASSAENVFSAAINTYSEPSVLATDDSGNVLTFDPMMGTYMAYDSSTEYARSVTLNAKPEVIDYTIVLSGGEAYKDSIAPENNITSGVAEMGLSFAGGTWTMNDFSFTTSAAWALNFRDENVSITVSGDNEISSGDAAGWSLAVVFDGNNQVASFSGNGCLTIDAGSGTGSRGITCNTLEVSGITLSVSANDVTSGTSQGISASGITVNNANVLAVAGSSESTESSQGIIVRSSISFTGTTGRVEGISNDDVSGYGIQISGSAPEVTAKDSDGNLLTFDPSKGAYFAYGSATDYARDVILAVPEEKPSVADAAVTLGKTSYVYAGTALTPTVTVTMDDGTVLTQDTDYTLAYSNNINAGTATVTVTGIGAYAGENSASFTIDPKTLSVSGTMVSDKIYDGKTDAEVSGSTLEGLIGADDVQLSASGEFVTKDAGTAKEVKVAYELSGDQKDNYVLEEPFEEKTANITKRDVTLASKSDSKVYDGSALTGGEVICEDTVFSSEATVKASGSITDAGSITNTIAVIGGTSYNEANYNLTKDEGTLEITQRSIKLLSGGTIKTYDGQALVCNHYIETGDNFVAGEGYTAVVSGSQTEVGSSKNTLKYTLNDGTKETNYNIDVTEGDLVVVAAETKIEEAEVDPSTGTASLVVDETETQDVAALNVVGKDAVVESNSDQTVVIQNVTANGGTASIGVSGSGVVVVGDISGTDVALHTENAGTIEVTSEINAEGQLNITTDESAENGQISLGADKTHTVGGDMVINNATDNVINGSGSPSEGNEKSAKIMVGGDVTINNYGHLNADVTATEEKTITIVNTSANTLIGNYTAEGGNIVISAGSGSIEDVLFSAENITINAGATPVVDENTKFTFSGSWTNSGALTVDMTGAGDTAYQLVDYTGSGSMTLAKYGTVTLTNNTGYTLKVQDNDLYAVKSDNVITITAASDSKVYDGSALTKDQYTYTQGVLIDGDTLTATVEGSVTDVGTAANKVTGYKVMRGDVDVTSDYTFTNSVDGELSITKRPVTLTSADASKEYDGTALTCDTVTVSGDGWVNGEGATYNVTGSQTEVGTSKNTFSYTLNANTKAGNYDVAKIEGDLIVTPASTVCSISNYNNTAKSDMVQIAEDGKAYVTCDSDSGYAQTGALYDMSGWAALETRRDFTGDGMADLQIAGSDGEPNHTAVAILRNEFDGNDIQLNYQLIRAYDNELWEYVGAADVNGDGKDETLLVQTSKGSDNGYHHVCAWTTDETGAYQVDQDLWVGSFHIGWSIAGTADVDGNGTDNVILRRADGQICYWSETGTNDLVRVWYSEGSSYLTSANFSGSGKDGILWNNADGDFFAWSDLDGDLVDVKIGNVSELGGNWSFAGAGDYDGDDADEILWCDSSICKMAYSEADKENFANLTIIA